MSFQWDCYLDIAEKLREQGIEASEGEGWFRCAVSRAYYAAFHEGLSYLKDPHLDHAGVAQKLGDPRSSRKDKSLGTWFNFMRSHRRKADYDLNVEFLAEDAEKVIQSARKFITLARS